MGYVNAENIFSCLCAAHVRVHSLPAAVWCGVVCASKYKMKWPKCLRVFLHLCKVFFFGEGTAKMT